jgi:polysaccharide biosynthesis/export protein
MNEHQTFERRRARAGRGLLLCFLFIGLLAAGQAFGQPLPQDLRSLPANDYKIGAKDLLQITVFELPELNQSVRVSEDGSISWGLMGKVDVSGMTAQELEKRLAALLDQKYTKGAHVTVFIQEYQQVAVMGAVGRPGMYQLIGPTTLLQMISQAGGLTADVMGELYVFRPGADGKQERIAISIQDLIAKGDQSLNIPLQPKDVVSIPADQTVSVYVYGEVKNPGALPFKKSKQLTLLQAIAQAGATTEWAVKSAVMIKRKDKATGKEIKLTVNLRNIIKGKISDIILEEGDVVIIP